ncbi:sensor histidine kinase [Actinospica robiniae]|uniref:sensor histidine kinase n=1 Tax=Actinospica robiniae TaxID=304901 RepID=UPI000402A178|nr:sensor histidine kinase [Actinospica robiniae]
MSLSMAWVSRSFAFFSITLGTILTAVHGHDGRVLIVQAVGLAIVGAAIAAWTLIESRTPPNTPPRPSLYLALGTVCVVSGVLSATHNGAWTIVLAGIATMVAGGDIALLPAVAITAAGVACTLVSCVVNSLTSGAALIGLPVTIVTGLTIGLRRRAYRVEAEQSAELLARTRQVQDLQRRADVLDERTRIAREIHDVLAHSLGGLGIQIQAARAVLTDSADIETALSVLGTAQRLASDGLTETRRALHALRSDTLSLDEELRSLAEQHGGMHRAKVEFEIAGTPRELPAAASIALLRVAQEAMVNAAKHGAGEAIELRLDYEADRVRLTVANRIAAAGQKTQAPAMQTADAGYGLAGMRERLLLIGGSLHAGPHDGRWTVTAELPHVPTPARPTTEGRDGEQ